MRLEKTIILSAVVILLFSLLNPAAGPSAKAGQLSGIWEGYHKGMQIQLVLNPDGTCRAEFFDTSDESVLFFNCGYRASYLYHPAAISLTSINSLNFSLHSVFTQPDADTLRLAEFAPAKKMRPIFFEKGKIITLKRVKDVSHES